MVHHHDRVVGISCIYKNRIVVCVMRTTYVQMRTKASRGISRRANCCWSAGGACNLLTMREAVNNVIDGEVTRGARRLTDFDSPGVAGSSRERETKAEEMLVRRYYLPSFSFFQLFCPPPSFLLPLFLPPHPPNIERRV